MTSLLGLPLEAALAELRSRGIEPEIAFTESPRHPAGGRARVVRVSEDGQRLLCARFPDQIAPEDDR